MALTTTELLTRQVKRHSLTNESDASDVLNILSDHEGRVAALEVLTKTLVWNEVPTGAINGINFVFVLANSPDSDEELLVFLNGLLMKVNVDYTVFNTMITFDLQQIPQTGDNLLATYAYS